MVHLLESAIVMNKYYSCLERPHSLSTANKEKGDQCR